MYIFDFQSICTKLPLIILLTFIYLNGILFFLIKISKKINKPLGNQTQNIKIYKIYHFFLSLLKKNHYIT